MTLAGSSTGCERTRTSLRRNPDARNGPAGSLAASADNYLEVHDQGPEQADVTEASGGIWERLHYDWSDPNRVVMTTTDSNAWGGNSGHTYTLTRQPNGTTDVDVVVVRDGKNFKGRMVGIVLSLFGKRVLGKSLGETVKAIEARSNDASPGWSGSRGATTQSTSPGTTSPFVCVSAGPRNASTSLAKLAWCWKRNP